MWNIQTFTELPSTQTLAREALSSGRAHHGDVFVALHQSDGRGQYQQRQWHDEAGANLLMSIVLTNIDSNIIDLMQFVAGLCVVSTLRSVLIQNLRSFDETRVQLKWPNDVLIDGRKIAGILCEATWIGLQLKGIVLGIGININQTEFADTISPRATSLRMVLDDSFILDEIRDILLATLQFTLSHYHNRALLLDDLQRELAWMTGLSDVDVTLSDGRVLLAISIVGINERGALHILTTDGVIMALDSATLNIRS